MTDTEGSTLIDTDKMLRILVIDDNMADVSLLRYGLDATGETYQLDVITDGESALKFIQKHRSTPLQHEPCVVVIDLHLPKFDGTTLLAELRRTPALSHLKAAVITSGASPQQEQELASLQVNLFQSKPQDLQEFFDLAQRLIDLCRDNEEDVAA